jgi:hypothetical protein
VTTREPTPRLNRKKLEKNYSCYVLITCEQPTKSGDLKAEMTFEGDEFLAAYLVEQAREFFSSAEDLKIR